jgi:hypothetical protein
MIEYMVYYGQDLLFVEADTEKVHVRPEVFVKYSESFESRAKPLGALTELEWAYRIFRA